MPKRTRWKVQERRVERKEAPAAAREAIGRGAAGAVTSWGSGVDHRETLRIFWEAKPSVLKVMNPEEIAASDDLVEEDWTQYWRASLKPFTAGPRFVLVPSWDTPPADSARKAIFIDPGMAFGAGDHPTTRLCVGMLDEMAARAPVKGPMIDIGAGTGVLSVAAALLGFTEVDALDIDPFCYASCRRNIAANGLKGLVRPVLSSLDLLEGTYPLALANVAPRQIESMAALIARTVRPGGLIILSGFGRAEEDRVMLGLGAQFKTVRKSYEEEWVALLAERGGGDPWPM